MQYTAMHWACKRGDENLVKLLGGVTRQVVNERSCRYNLFHVVFGIGDGSRMGDTHLCISRCSFVTRMFANY
ncbi:hypothetical protein B5X24_HaOG205247 [Helicoverpa armigera]|uniref:Uncharacterized protein n=1 Tax=Helicoverpa armigera TaxID=29058 RepID=A0A2W1BTN7_HELAM|nr:hypothetical protein B5X24_HaOG205247 [Helicoverpa armigera]